MKNYGRYFLMLGLLTALGANLSWNPEFFLVSREDYKTMGSPQETIMSSETAPAVTSIDLGDIDEGKKGIKLEYSTIDRADGTKTPKYTLSGTDQHISMQTPVVSDENLNNADLLKRALADHAIELLNKKGVGKKKISDGDEAGEETTKKKKKKKNAVYSDCEEDEDSDQLECQKGEMDALIENCEEINEDKSGDRETREKNRGVCKRKVVSYFQKYLRSSLKDGLAADPKSDLYAEAVAIRDGLIEDLPKKFRNEIKKDLVTISANAVIDRTRNHYQNVLRATQNQGITGAQAQEYAALSAKQFLLKETKGEAGARLCSALAEVSVNTCMRASYDTRVGMQLSSNPEYTLYTENYESQLTLLSQQSTAESFVNALNGELTGTVPNVNGVPADLFAARSTGVRANAEPIPGTGQGPLNLPQGLTAPSGQISLPSYNGQTGNPVILGNPVTTQNGVIGPVGPIVPGQSFTVPWSTPNTYNSMSPVGNYPQSPFERTGRL